MNLIQLMGSIMIMIKRKSLKMKEKKKLKIMVNNGLRSYQKHGEKKGAYIIQ